MAGNRNASRKSRYGKSSVRKRIKITFALFLVFTSIIFSVGAAIYIPLIREAQDKVEEIGNLNMKVSSSQASTIVSSDGKILYSLMRERRKVVDTRKLPKYVRDAIVAAEDRRFYTHSGVDQTSLARAAVGLLQHSSHAGGGSTITMQLAKKLVNGDERSYMRKLRDIAVAQQIEKVKSKEEILDIYMNYVYFGEGALGIQSAAETYFGKNASQLSIAEAAMIARCIRTPSRDNPLREYRETKQMTNSLARRDYVLGVMKEEGMITEEEYQSALEEQPKLKRDARPDRDQIFGAPYFVAHVKAELKRDLPEVYANLETGGYRIETTLDYDLQKTAESAVAETIRRHRSKKVTSGAMLLIDGQGKILVEVGGPDYSKSQYNIVTQGSLQPGSSFKPFIYATALKDGLINANSMVSNAAVKILQTEHPPTYWEPKNLGKIGVGGQLPLKTAFKLSVNLPAVNTCILAGPARVVQLAHEVFGFESDIPAVPSIALGSGTVSPLEMAQAYSVFMLKGNRVMPYPITRVIGPDGEVIRDYSPTVKENVLDSSVCETIDDLMRAVVESGTGTAARVVPNARGKTGTTTRAKDAWFCGYSDGLVCISWVGNNQNGRALPMANQVYGGTVTVEMWRDVMKVAHRKYAEGGRQVPTPEVSAIKRPIAEAPQAELPKPVDVAPPVVGPANGVDVAPVPAQPDPTNGTELAPPAVEIHGKEHKRSEAKDDMVSVEICADSGQLATAYCNETITRKFRRGTEPKTHCNLHRGTN